MADSNSSSINAPGSSRGASDIEQEEEEDNSVDIETNGSPSPAVASSAALLAVADSLSTAATVASSSSSVIRPLPSSVASSVPVPGIHHQQRMYTIEAILGLNSKQQQQPNNQQQGTYRAYTIIHLNDVIN